MAEPQGLLWPFVHTLETWHTAMAVTSIMRLAPLPSIPVDLLDPW